jgi:sec-independent protein translocase protein TatA
MIHQRRLPSIDRQVFSGLENPTHWLFIGIVALLVFGPRRLPELGRSLGSGLRGFREAMSGEGDRDERPTVTATTAERSESAGQETQAKGASRSTTP